MAARRDNGSNVQAGVKPFLQYALVVIGDIPVLVIRGPLCVMVVVSLDINVMSAHVISQG